MNSTAKTLTFIIIALLVIGFIVYPRYFEDKKEGGPALAGAPVKRSLLEINAVIVRNESLDYELKVTGSVVANESVDLKAEVSGRITGLNFKEGQRVKKGQLLVQLNDSEIRAEIDKLNFTKKLNEDSEFRQKQLLAKEAISQEEYETSLTVLKTTLADIKVRQVQLEKHQIRAPFDGIAGLRKISNGSYISISDELVSVYSINPLKIDFSVPGKYAAQVNTGDLLKFEIDGYDDEIFEGKIYAIEPQIDPETRSIRIRAISDNRENKLYPGQFAKIRLTISTFEEAILIPTEAVVPELNGKKVYVRNNGIVENRRITTGIRMANQIQVVEGLEDGDTVLTTGILQLQPGMKVNLNIQNNE